MHENAEILPAHRRRPELILGRPGGDDGWLLGRREGFPGEMAQATPDIGARQGSRGQKRRVAQWRGRGGVVGLERLGAFLAALPRAMVPTVASWRQIGGSSHHSDDSTLSNCMF